MRTASFPGELSLISWWMVQKLYVSGLSQPSHMHTHKHMHSEYKAFCQLENRGEEEEGVSKSEERKLKSRANWTACFLRAPLTAQCGWLCLFLSLSVPTSLTLSDYLFPGEEREDGREGKEGEEEASFHSDGWWKRTRQVLLGCTPLLFLSLSVCCSSNANVLILSPSPSLSPCLSPKHFFLPVSNLLIIPSLLPFFYVHYQNIHSLLSIFPVIFLSSLLTFFHACF